MSRAAFSTLARNFYKWTWKGTKAVPEIEQLLEAKTKGNKKFAKVTEAIVHGQLHISDSDSEPRASVLMREDSNRSLVTAHVYPRTGRVIFSKASFNRDEPEVELETIGKDGKADGNADAKAVDSKAK